MWHHCCPVQKGNKNILIAVTLMTCGYIDDVVSLLSVQKGKKKNALKESVMEVGFTYYLILARMMDIDPHLLQGG